MKKTILMRYCFPLVTRNMISQTSHNPVPPLQEAKRAKKVKNPKRNFLSMESILLVNLAKQYRAKLIDVQVTVSRERIEIWQMNLLFLLQKNWMLSYKRKNNPRSPSYGLTTRHRLVFQIWFIQRGLRVLTRNHKKFKLNQFLRMISVKNLEKKIASLKE